MKSNIFKKAHELTKKIIKIGDNYRATFRLCLSFVYSQIKKGVKKMVELKGTEKQVKWATEIREQLLIYVNLFEEVAKDDIAELQKKIEECKKKEELCEVTSEINSIKSKICMAIVEKQKADEKEQARIAEQNSHEEKVDIEDIFAEMCSESVVDDEKEDLNIF